VHDHKLRDKAAPKHAIALGERVAVFQPNDRFDLPEAGALFISKLSNSRFASPGSKVSQAR